MSFCCPSYSFYEVFSLSELSLVLLQAANSAQHSAVLCSLATAAGAAVAENCEAGCSACSVHLELNRKIKVLWLLAN